MILLSLCYIAVLCSLISAQLDRKDRSKNEDKELKKAIDESKRMNQSSGNYLVIFKFLNEHNLLFLQLSI